MDLDFLTETITPNLSTLLNIGGTGALQVSSGTTAQRPVTGIANGAIRYNTTLNTLESYVNSGWVSLTGASGTVTSVALTLPSMFSVTGSPITTAGTLTATLATQPINTVLAGPTIGSPASPTFRTLGLATNDINDVTITSAASGQVLSYNGSRWVNTSAVNSAATANVGVAPTAGGTTWTLVSGSVYTATFTHNLGTTNLSVTCYDITDNSIIIPHYLTTPTANTIVMQVMGNTRTVKIVAVANGLSIAAGGSTPSSVITQVNGVQVSAAASTLNFTGQAVNVTAASTTTTIAIGSRFTYFANSLDSPNTSDYTVNAFAPVITDATYTSLAVRAFSNTIEQGVSTLVSIPVGVTTITLRIRGRALAAPVASSFVQPRIYSRLLPNNSAVGAWSAGINLSTISIPTNANFQYYVYTASIASLGLTAGNLYQLELTRYNTGVTSNLSGAFNMAELTIELA